MSYTFNLYSLNKDSIESTNPFIVSELDQNEHYYNEILADLGFVFSTPNEAMKAAKQLYYTRQYAKTGRSNYDRTKHNWVPYYDRLSKKILGVDMKFPTPGCIYFDTELDMENAVKQFDIETFCHYVLNLYNAVVYTEKEV